MKEGYYLLKLLSLGKIYLTRLTKRRGIQVYDPGRGEWNHWVNCNVIGREDSEPELVERLVKISDDSKVANFYKAIL